MNKAIKKGWSSHSGWDSLWLRPPVTNGGHQSIQPLKEYHVRNKMSKINA